MKHLIMLDSMSKNNSYKVDKCLFDIIICLKQLSILTIDFRIKII